MTRGISMISQFLTIIFIISTLTNIVTADMSQNQCIDFATRIDEKVQSQAPLQLYVPRILDPCTNTYESSYWVYDAEQRYMRAYFPATGTVHGFQYQGGPLPEAFGDRAFFYKICRNQPSSVFIKAINNDQNLQQIC